MTKRITINMGHVTNSSSVVHHFDKALLKNQKVSAFLSTYGIQDGIVGKDLWHRGECASFLVTAEQKAKAQSQFTGEDNPFDFDIQGPNVGTDDNEVVVIYGDEYTNFASVLCRLLSEAAEERGSGNNGANDFN